jgi:hypothetical protein
MAEDDNRNPDGTDENMVPAQVAPRMNMGKHIDHPVDAGAQEAKVRAPLSTAEGAPLSY